MIGYHYGYIICVEALKERQKKPKGQFLCVYFDYTCNHCFVYYFIYYYASGHKRSPKSVLNHKYNCLLKFQINIVSSLLFSGYRLIWDINSLIDGFINWVIDWLIFLIVMLTPMYHSLEWSSNFKIKVKTKYTDYMSVHIS